MIKRFEGYIFDLDGTLYLGDRLIKGTKKIIDKLQSAGKSLLFLTNKTIVSRVEYVEKLKGFGINVNIDDILSPTTITIDYLKQYHCNDKIYIIGEDLIKKEIVKAGFKMGRTPRETDVVIVSWDRNFHYDHLNFAFQAIKEGAIAVATNPDRTCPVDSGEVPDCGGMIGAIESTTNRNIDIVLGKPSSLIAETALRILNVNRDDCLIVGDRLETDIAMGNHAGINTALVLTGVTTVNEIKGSKFKPDFVLRSINELVE